MGLRLVAYLNGTLCLNGVRLGLNLKNVDAKITCVLKEIRFRVRNLATVLVGVIV